MALNLSILKIEVMSETFFNEVVIRSMVIYSRVALKAAYKRNELSQLLKTFFKRFFFFNPYKYLSF